jgi:origin recognition complex subunit 5
MDPHVLPVLTRLQELTRHNVCTIFISRIVFDKFRTATGLIEPLPIQFSAYTKAQVIRILQLSCPSQEQVDQQLFASFATIIYDAFQNSCKDLNELIRVTVKLWPKYIEPVQTGHVKPTDTIRLYTNIAPILRDWFAKLFLRELSSSELEKRFDQTNLGMQWSSHIDLTHRTRFLLMAAFIASYNKQTHDRKLFAKSDGKKRAVRKTHGVSAFNETGNKVC